MQLTELQRDAVTELGNVGISQAARQLSEMLDDEIYMEIPKVELLTSGEISDVLMLEAGEVECIYQQLNGDLSGRVALLLHSQGSRQLLHALIGEQSGLQGMDMRSYEHEAMLEIGNILISSCISTMADMLRLSLTLSVPQYAETSMSDLVSEASEGSEGAEQPALLVHARIVASRNSMAGHVVLMLSARVVDRLLQVLPGLTDSGVQG